jgi:peptidoglycan/xylan/chitin deacetylase (PgdA/CDA1 family)
VVKTTARDDAKHLLDRRRGLVPHPRRGFGAHHAAQWDALPARVEGNFRRLLDILGETKTRATCFFIGHIAKRFPQLVREARERGHEIASHSYEHRLIYTMTPAEFLEDAKRARQTLEDISGGPVAGFRASGSRSPNRRPGSSRSWSRPATATTRRRFPRRAGTAA